jgi:hypothetical protein
VEQAEKTDYQFKRQVSRLVDRIDDWKRGLTDWEEVERELNVVRDEVKKVRSPK